MLDYQSWYFIALPFYLLFLGLMIYKKRRGTDILLYSLVFFYFVGLLGVTFFPLPFQKNLIEDSRQSAYLINNFIPFHSITDIITHDNFTTIVRQILGNVILFLPLGFFIPLVWQKNTTFFQVLKIGILFSLGIEVTQFFISLILGFTYKVTDIDDVILNAMGCMVGYCLYMIFKKGYNKAE